MNLAQIQVEAVQNSFACIRLPSPGYLTVVSTFAAAVFFVQRLVLSRECVNIFAISYKLCQMGRILLASIDRPASSSSSASSASSCCCFCHYFELLLLRLLSAVNLHRNRINLYISHWLLITVSLSLSLLLLLYSLAFLLYVSPACLSPSTLSLSFSATLNVWQITPRICQIQIDEVRSKISKQRQLALSRVARADKFLLGGVTKLENPKQSPETIFRLIFSRC